MLKFCFTNFKIYKNKNHNSNVFTKAIEKKDGDIILFLKRLAVVSALCITVTTGSAYAGQITIRSDVVSPDENVTETVVTIVGDVADEAVESTSSAIKETQDNAAKETSTQVIEEVKNEPTYVDLGEFTITHYCCEKRKHICGTGTGLTYMETQVRPGVIAVDPKVIPLGSKVMINGVVYTAEDTGGSIKGNKIDIAVNTHSEALERGRFKAEAYLVVE